MLYRATRNKTDTYTAHRALTQERTPDGGYFVPFRLPVLDRHAVNALKERTFGENVAELLNLFFATHLTGWDVECCIGKAPVRLQTVSHRVLLAELWHNPRGQISYIIDNLYEKLCPEGDMPRASNWAQIAIRISLLFGIYGLLAKSGTTQMDIAVNTGDFTVPMAAWYARKMGLPIGTIVCSCNENSATWDLLHRGEMSTGAPVVSSVTPLLDVSNPEGIERLIFEVFGTDEVQKYVNATKKRGLYQIRPDMLQSVSDGMFVSVVGKNRIESVIHSAFASNQQLLDPYAAVSYGGLQDYRAKVGESNPTLLLFENSPLIQCQTVQKATGLTPEQIHSMCE